MVLPKLAPGDYLGATHGMHTLRFAVDKMLGRLATWLRLTGHDATYGAHLSGRTLIGHARAQGRTILTRDRRVLHASPAPATLFVLSDHFRDQLRQVCTTFHLDPFAHILTRCVRCNELVVPAFKAEMIDLIPQYVYATQDQFVRCRCCRRVYWSATHCERVRSELHAMGFRPRTGESC